MRSGGIGFVNSMELDGSFPEDVIRETSQRA